MYLGITKAHWIFEQDKNYVSETRSVSS
jgi:hypothetical protein